MPPIQPVPMIPTPTCFTAASLLVWTRSMTFIFISFVLLRRFLRAHLAVMGVCAVHVPLVKFPVALARIFRRIVRPGAGRQALDFRAKTGVDEAGEGIA